MIHNICIIISNCWPLESVLDIPFREQFTLYFLTSTLKEMITVTPGLSGRRRAPLAKERWNNSSHGHTVTLFPLSCAYHKTRAVNRVPGAPLKPCSVFLRTMEDRFSSSTFFFIVAMLDTMHVAPFPISILHGY